MDLITELPYMYPCQKNIFSVYSAPCVLFFSLLLNRRESTVSTWSVWAFNRRYAQNLHFCFSYIFVRSTYKNVRFQKCHAFFIEAHHSKLVPKMHDIFTNIFDYILEKSLNIFINKKIKHYTPIIYYVLNITSVFTVKSGFRLVVNSLWIIHFSNTGIIF